MKHKIKTVALIEIGGSHTECLETQIKALNSKGISVAIVCNDFLLPRIEQISMIQYALLLNKDDLQFKKATIEKIRRFFKENKIYHAVFNTAEIKVIRSFLFTTLLFNVRFSGVVHNASKIKFGNTLYFLRLLFIKRLLVLGQHLIKNQQLEHRKNISYFYPCYFPLKEAIKSLTKVKNRTDFWVTIPGSVDANRKNYKGLLSLIQANNTIPNIKFILLGIMNKELFPDIYAQILEVNNKQANRIHFFENHISNQMLYQYVKLSDVILPLVSRYGFYSKHRISGAFNLALGFQKPMLLASDSHSTNEFSEIAVCYQESDLIETLNDLYNNKETRLTVIKNNYINYKWSVGYNISRYLETVLY